jgi:DNA repair protein RecO (recombination protein O)
MVGLVQPFISLQIGWVGRGELKTLIAAEAVQTLPKLSGQKILLGLYLNELLIRLLQGMDPHPALFYHYDATLTAIEKTTDSNKHQIILRQFELFLLAELGYGLNLENDGKTGQAIVPELLYSYDPAMGLFEASSISPMPALTISGASIIALQSGDFTKDNELQEAKRLMRRVLSQYLEGKPLQSRKLFQKEFQKEKA